MAYMEPDDLVTAREHLREANGIVSPEKQAALAALAQAHALCSIAESLAKLNYYGIDVSPAP